MSNKIFKTITKKTSNWLYKLFFLCVFKKARYESILPLKKDLLIISVAFNNSETISIQYSHLVKNLKEDFDYLIADNSSKENISDELKIFCEKNNLSYIRLPKNPLTNIRTSGSHSIALNWCYRNIIKKNKPKYFGLLDHDIFPIRDVEIVKNMKNGFWGVVRTKKEKWWYFWPGFSFFEYEKFKKYRFDFFPYHADRNGLIFLDTGGSNYNSICKKIDRNSISVAESVIIDIPTKKPLVIGRDSSQTFEIIDNKWMHIRQISWREESFNKMSEFDGIINIANEIIEENSKNKAWQNSNG